MRHKTNNTTEYIFRRGVILAGVLTATALVSGCSKAGAEGARKISAWKPKMLPVKRKKRRRRRRPWRPSPKRQKRKRKFPRQ